MQTVSSQQLYTWLEEVKDPEIPVLSLVDLGVITGVEENEGNVKVELTPTFVGCPALDMMKEDIVSVLQKHGMANVAITVNYRDPWSSDKISEKGRQALKNFGLAPPMPAKQFLDISILEEVPCPRCQGTNTQLRNAFGPTLCRSIHYCLDCRKAFEQFKPL